MLKNLKVLCCFSIVMKKMLYLQYKLILNLDMDRIQFKGARWFKCDLHLHTPASECFKDKTVTAEQWVQAVLDAGLNCVAVTDHNSGAMIDQIKTAAADKNVTVFPGVEITCDTSKIHLLILFDVDKTTQFVEDFLIECGISRESFAKSDAHSTKTVLDVAKLADSKGALVIPAHIDEFNGLAYCSSNSSVSDFIQLPFINGVQFVHQEFLEPNLRVNNNADLLQTINAYYGNSDRIRIGEDNVRVAYNGMKKVAERGLKFLTFSDNPDAEQPSKHGLSGIGCHYSWIKMDEKPTLESLRQALLMPERTYHCYEQPDAPYKTPSLWIKKIAITNTTLTKKDVTFEIDFNPQLNSIIGGRGSGKSSILRFLRGVFHNYSDLDNLMEIKKDQEEFFKTQDDKQGVLKDDSKIEVYFVRDSTEYKITYTHATKVTLVESLDYQTNSFTPITDEGFVDFFKTEQYSQKQIYSIAQSTNSLRNRIDSAIPEVVKLKEEINQLCSDYKSAMSEKRSVSQLISGKGKLKTEINDLENKITLLKQSGISDLISNRQKFVEQKDIVQKNIEKFDIIKNVLTNAVQSLSQIPSFVFDGIDDEYRAEVEKIFDNPQFALHNFKDTLQQFIQQVEEAKEIADNSLQTSKLYSDYNANENSFIQKKKELESKGVSEMTEFEHYSQQIVKKSEELKILEQKEISLKDIEERITNIYNSIRCKRNELTSKRQNFVSGITTKKVKATVIPHGDKVDFIIRFRSIIQKRGTFENEVNNIVEKVFPHGVFSQDEFCALKEELRKIYVGESEGNYGGRFKNMIRELNAEQIDDIDLLVPEDDIVMQYKNRDNTWKPLTIASAGQKTTAILTFILSFGDCPLILDQPEDDLDNKLVYDLIVDKMREIKKHRQVIVVTHNANIPVNGDAEYVVSLSASKKTLSIQAEGTIENEKVKTEICDVMEGGKEAFDIRAKRYSN